MVLPKEFFKKVDFEKNQQRTKSLQNFPDGKSKPLKRQEKIHLKMSSAEVVCCKLLPNNSHELSIEANSVDPEETAPIGAV